MMEQIRIKFAYLHNYMGSRVMNRYDFYSSLFIGMSVGAGDLLFLLPVAVLLPLSLKSE